MSTILAFDTATAACSTALWRDGALTQQFEVAPRRHNALLLPMIDRLLQDASISITDLDAVAFGNGPGSFMGLRIAAGVAQGLAFGAGIPVIPVSTLQALAQTAYWETQSRQILAGWDARMNQIYWGIYEVQNDCMQPLVADRLSDPSDVQLPDDDYCAAGNAWSVYADALPNIEDDLKKDSQDYYPTAKAVAHLAVHALGRGEAVAPEALELSYLRNRVAEKPSR